MRFTRLNAGGAALTAIIVGAAISLTGSPAQSTNQADEQQSSTGSDAEVVSRVKAALHADPYVYDKHIDVSTKNGAVVLTGFVSSDWDLRNAIRIATDAAGGRRVIDSLSIKEGGVR